MKIIFVHGWSVTNTNTYGELPASLESNPAFQVSNVYLGKYVSFVDTVTLDDIARAFDQAINDALGTAKSDGFACITHSTGGPVVRLWMKLFYGNNLSACPMKHLVMLAPANHGSALAQLGKSVVGRFMSLTEGVEPGVRVLDWLELGSDESWVLNTTWLDYDCTAAGIFTFVLTGQSIDRSFYDHLNSYTGEPGSDGVVRAAAANMNYSLLQLHQDGDNLVQDVSRRRQPTAFGILPGRAHSGTKMGIIRSVTLENSSTHPTAIWVAECLRVTTRDDYIDLCKRLDALTAKTQDAEHVTSEMKLFGEKKYVTDRYSMVVFRLTDDRGQALTDYDVYLTGGPNYDADDLPEGFFVDRQRNRHNVGNLTYYLDSDVLSSGLLKVAMKGCIGFRIVARPQRDNRSLAFYVPLDYRTNMNVLGNFLRPNEALMVEIKLKRQVDSAVFRLGTNLGPETISPTPLGKLLP